MPSNHLIFCCPLLSRLQSFPASGSFPMSHLFTSGSQSIGASASVLSTNIMVDFLYGWLVWSPWHSMYSQESSPAQFQSINSLAFNFLYMITGKTIALTIWTCVGKVLSLLFNMLSKFFLAFLPRNKHLLFSRLQSPSAVLLELKKIMSFNVSIFSLIYLPWSDLFHGLLGSKR